MIIHIKYICINHWQEGAALWKLPGRWQRFMTMPRHFGGIHAVAMAFSTVRVSDAVRARAREMGVALVDSIRKLPAARLAVHLHGAL